MSLPSMQFPITARLEQRIQFLPEDDLGFSERDDQYDCVLYVGHYEFFRCPADQYLAGFGRTERGEPVDATLAGALKTALGKLRES
jgi:hypothetical protein